MQIFAKADGISLDLTCLIGKESGKARLTDNEIIDAVNQGNTGAFKELVERYESRVAATVYGMLGKVPEAEDIGQETFIRFYKNLKQFRGDASVSTYLTRIAINLSLNEIKRRKRKNVFFNNTDLEDMEIEDKSGTINSGEEKTIIEKAIQNLEPKLRSVVVLRLVEEFSTKETAKILKIPIGTVLSRLARAQSKLREKLAPVLEVSYE